jgi:ABC-2 type transport system ATP-binding protein
MNHMIEARDVKKRYGIFQALKGVDCTVEKGRIVGLIGPNGAGKTTLIKALLGLTPFEGELRVLGLDPHSQRSELMQQVCFIADVAILPRWIRVKEAIEFVQSVHPRFSRETCERFLARTKIGRNAKVASLSKGMVAQLHLALVMAIDAKLLVLDEPTLGLDILYRKEFYQSLLNDYFDHEKTILITTHQVEEIEHILTDVLFIRDGRISMSASMDEIGDRFTEVMTTPDKREQALGYKPVDERQVFGKHIFLFDGLDRGAAEQLGECRTPGVADIFVAVMKGTYQ